MKTGDYLSRRVNMDGVNPVCLRIRIYIIWIKSIATGKISYGCVNVLHGKIGKFYASRSAKCHIRAESRNNSRDWTHAKNLNCFNIVSIAQLKIDRCIRIKMVMGTYRNMEVGKCGKTNVFSAE